MRSTPASGGAAVFSPGTNFASTRERAPLPLNARSMRRTHESGSSEIRHSQPSTRMPATRPTPYQMVSAINEAAEATTRISGRLSRPVPATPPDASRNGSAGNGRPICSANTQPKTTE
jgi:hypothetical protein